MSPVVEQIITRLRSDWFVGVRIEKHSACLADYYIA
jgi:hypothetical protein